MASERAGVVWVSTSTRTRGGIATYVRTMQATSLWSSWRVRHVTTHVDGSRARQVVVFLAGWATVLRLLATRRVLVLHLMTASRGSFFRKSLLQRCARWSGVPVVLHVHGGGFVEFAGRLGPRRRRWLIATLEGSAVVIGLGERWSARLRALAPRAHVVGIDNPIDAAAPPAPRRTAAAPTALFVGRLGPGKGTPTLLDAWAALGAERRGARLLLVGDGDVEGHRRRASELGLDGSVEVAAWRPDVAALLRDADVFVLPSEREGQPMAVLEAMVAGLCVVVSDAGGMPDLVDDGTSGVVVPTGDVGALRDALAHVLGDPALRARLGAAARARAEERHAPETVAGCLDTVYAGLAARPR